MDVSPDGSGQSSAASPPGSSAASSAGVPARAAASAASTMRSTWSVEAPLAETEPTAVPCPVPCRDTTGTLTPCITPVGVGVVFAQPGVALVVVVTDAKHGWVG